MNEQQKQSTTSAQEYNILEWRTLSLAWLKAHALVDPDGLKECVQATIDALRAEGKAPKLSFETVTLGQMMEMATKAAEAAKPVVTRIDATPAVTMPEGPKTASGRAGAAHLAAWRERKKAEAAKADAAQPAEPAPLPAIAPQDAPSPPAPVSNGYNPAAGMGPLQQRQEACMEEIKVLLNDVGHISPAAAKSLAQRHGLSLVGTEQLVTDTMRAWVQRMDRAAARTEKAGAV